MTGADRPLVAVTADERRDDSLSRALAAWAEPLPLQTVAIEPPIDDAPLAAALTRLAEFDWIVFTSANAVEALCGRAAWCWPPAGAPRPPRIAAVGPSTARALRARGVEPAVVPVDAGAAGVGAAMADAGSLTGRRVLWPRSEIARDELARDLAGRGAGVEAPVAYRTVFVRPAALERIRAALYDARLAAVTFLSPSSAHGLAAAVGAASLADLPGRTIVASIGPTTSDALRALGAPPDVEADRPVREVLAQALARRVSRRREVRA